MIDLRARGDVQTKSLYSINESYLFILYSKQHTFTRHQSKKRWYTSTFAPLLLALLCCLAIARCFHFRRPQMRGFLIVGQGRRHVIKREHKVKSTPTYQDEAYEMFLSNIEKDMIDGWKDHMERSMAEEVPSFGLDTAYGDEIQRNCDDDDDDDDDDEEENEVVTIESESDGTNSKEFLLSLSTNKLKERLREAGLPIEGNKKIDLVRRLLGQKPGERRSTRNFLSTLTAEQLRERLREAGLPITGHKQALVDRLLGKRE